MRTNLLLIGLIFAAFTCNQCKPREGLLIASLQNIPEWTVLNIIDIDSGKTISRIPVFDNKFEFKYNFPTPRKIAIQEDNPKYPKYTLLIWLENSKVKVSGNYDYFVNAKVEGSASNELYQQFELLIRKFGNKLSDLTMAKRIANKQNVKDSISKEIDLVTTQYRNEKTKLYSENIESEVTLFNLAYEVADYNSVLNKMDISHLYTILPEKFKLSSKGLMLEKYISLPEIPEVGEKFIDIVQFTPEGNSESISKNLGKYTIIEFWSSTCGPCRAEHPLMRKLYNLYHDKGLNIIGISGDGRKEDWIGAIKKDSIPWLNLSDLKGWNNEAFMIYGIKGIPQMLILDEKGIIVDNQFEITFLEHTPDRVFSNQKISRSEGL
jgi:thiol-disulfide isomerase/thioredoxin